MEYVHNESAGNATSTSKSHIARAKKLVVLSAGAFGSPAILERSGIGSRKVLERNGVKQEVDLPGVGENYNGAFTDATLYEPPNLTLTSSLRYLKTTGCCSFRSTHRRIQRLWMA